MKNILLTALCFAPAFLFGQMTINTLSFTDVNCNGNCNGTADIQVTGGTTPIVLTIINGLGTETIVQTNDSTWEITALCAGNWNIEVADALPSTVATSVLISEPTLLTVSTPTVVNVSCFGTCDGSIQALASGGVAPYTYMWNDPGNQTSPNMFMGCAGTYSVLITDMNGCVNDASASIQEPLLIITNAIVTQPSCVPGCDGILDANITTGGSPPYAYVWSNGATTAVQTGLCSGTYLLDVVDANGCLSGNSYILGPTITATTTNSDPTCGLSDGAISITPTSGIGPWTFAWTGPNGFSSTNQNISNIPNGTYDVVVTDSPGCTGITSVSLNNIPESGINANVISQDATCGDGSAIVNITLGTAPFSAIWSNGDTNVTTNNLNAGNYSVYLEDANGCDITIPVTIADLGGSNCGSINGTIYSDLNSTCLFDGGDQYLPNRIVTANPGNYIATADANGFYEFNIPFGTYTINRTSVTGYIPTCLPTGSSVTTNLGTPSATDVSFGDSLEIIADASVYISGWNVRPQLSSTHTVYLQNPTNTSIGGELYYVIDSSMTFSSANPTPDLINGDTLMWNIAPFSTIGFYSNPYHIYGFGPNAPIGSMVQQCAWFTSQQTETSLANNNTCLDQIVTGSYDPNDKSVFPEGGIRTKDSTLQYYVRFQNTGTDTAFTVVITDTLSQHLEVASLNIISSSHPMTYQIVNNNVLKFTFSNILLPDSNVNEPASHGSVMYSIRQNVSNAIGDTIENTANIYFDFNAPVITNTTISPIVPKQFDVIGTSQNVSCFGDCNGNVSVTATGDEPPFLILWDDLNASTTNAVDSLCFGTYTARVIDAEGDTIFQTVDIIEPNALTISSTTVDDINNMCQGQGTVTPSGGSGTYIYLWDVAAGSQTTATATGLCGATYNVTVTDAQGCSITESVTVLNSLGINEESLNAFVSPNPFDTEVILHLTGVFDNVVVLNVIGKLVKQIETSESKTLINLSNENSGIYFIQIQNKGEVLKTIKTIKQ